MIKLVHMGRKKNKDENFEKPRRSNIAGDAKRSIAAIFLFALSILFFLGFIGSAGILGQYLDKIAGLLFGWGKWVSPVLLIGAGVVLLFRKETFFYVSKLIGMGTAYLSLLGFFHIFYDAEKFSKIASKGLGGGYIGYGISFLLVRFTGIVGGIVILAAIFLIGIIFAFNFSIIDLVKMRFKKKETISEEELEVPGAKEAPAEKKTEFVKGPDEDGKESRLNALRNRFSGSFSKKEKEEKEEKEFERAGGRISSADWLYPPVDLLEAPSGQAKGGDTAKNAEIIQKTFSHFGIEVESGEIKTGPTITQYSFRPAVGIKLSRITGLGNDLALALAAHPIRIEAPIPGKSLVGIEVPNKSVATVKLKEFLLSPQFQSRKSKSHLTLCLGKDVSGNLIFSDLDKMPHLLIAGSTGTGKSVCINTVLLSLLYQNSPSDLRLILVDPKRVELSLYNGMPHLLTDTIVENGKVLSALKWALGEMEKRYRMLQETGSRDLISYNQKITSGETKKYIDKETGEEKEEEIEKLPYIVIVIDELADLMVSHGREVEGAIIRLAQMARAVGIHLIVSTQRPSVEVLTGLIKANITTRIAFKVATQIDSRTILDTGGAEKLLGNGDMLFLNPTYGSRRLQGVFCTESEVKKVVKFIKAQKVEIEETDLSGNLGNTFSNGEIDFESIESHDNDDERYEEAKREVIRAGKASASLLQRRMGVGYARAARLLDMLEDNNVVGPQNGAKPREVFVSEKEPNYEDAMSDQQKRDKWQI
jgi:DNA segregation ATPase FtsK/SpoIIIE, S-DNA-T family